MKTKKRFNFRKICYLMLVLSVLGGISMSYCFGNELKENNVKNCSHNSGMTLKRNVPKVQMLRQQI